MESLSNKLLCGLDFPSKELGDTLGIYLASRVPKYVSKHQTSLSFGLSGKV